MMEETHFVFSSYTQSLKSGIQNTRKWKDPGLSYRGLNKSYPCSPARYCSQKEFASVDLIIRGLEGIS